MFSVRRVIAQITSPVGTLLGGVLADQVMEPALKPGGVFSSSLGKFFGTSQGSGMSVIIAVCAVFTALVGVFGYLNPLVRNVEAAIPDHDQVPGNSEQK